MSHFHVLTNEKCKTSRRVFNFLALVYNISTYHFVGRKVHALDKKYSNVEKDDLDVNFISLSKVAKATNNFSIDNKLGQGGFGPVYKVTS